MGVGAVQRESYTSTNDALPPRARSFSQAHAWRVALGAGGFAHLAKLREVVAERVLVGGVREAAQEALARRIDVQVRHLARTSHHGARGLKVRDDCHPESERVDATCLRAEEPSIHVSEREVTEMPRSK